MPDLDELVIGKIRINRLILLFRWWTCLLKNEEEIDPSSIKAEIGMDDLQEDEQVKIEELMWKDEQKKQGLRTNDQQVFSLHIISIY